MFSYPKIKFTQDNVKLNDTFTVSRENKKSNLRNSSTARWVGCVPHQQKFNMILIYDIKSSLQMGTTGYLGGKRSCNNPDCWGVSVDNKELTVGSTISKSVNYKLVLRDLFSIHHTDTLLLHVLTHNYHAIIMGSLFPSACLWSNIAWRCQRMRTKLRSLIEPAFLDL